VSLPGNARSRLSQSTFRHNALVYDSDEDYAARSVDFLRAGVEAGEGGLVAAPRDRLALIRAEFDGLPEEVVLLDPAAAENRPARVIAAYYAALVDHLRHFPALRLLTEVRYGPTAGDWQQWIGYEAALDRAFSGLPVWALCAYDARRAPAAMLEAVWRTHPEVVDGKWRPSPAYENPEQVARSLEPEPQPLPELRHMPGGPNPEALRERLAGFLATAGVEGEKALAMLIAANEVAVNAWRHGIPPVELRVGRHEGRCVCEIVDRGPGFDDPLAGFDPPPDRDSRAPGLWVVRQLVWRLETFAAPGGFTVRLWL
jgi:anti-sigma regulatory factor (Ser/Thr protein kinase)